MHEVGIAQGLLDLAVSSCRKQGYSGIEFITVKIGKASGVMPDALLFAFETMKEGTIAEKARLEINEIPVTGFCNNCKTDFTSNESFIQTICPRCESLDIRIDTGKELNIDEMEVF